MKTTETAFKTAVWSSCTPRLLRADSDREDAAAYRDQGGYLPLVDKNELLGEVESGGLVGRGGAAFPLGLKLRAVRDNGEVAGGTVVVANGEEGEPASFKDRWLLRHRPHLVLDGLRLAARMAEATRAHVYISDRRAAESVETALAEVDAALLDGIAISVV